MRWLVLSFLVCACTNPQLAAPPWRKPPPPEQPEDVGGTVFTPTAPPAARYNDPAPKLPPSPVADAVAVAVSVAAFELKLPQPERDGRLDAAAAELAAFLPKDVTPPQDLTAFALTHFGIVEPFAYVVVATRGQRDAMALADDLRQTMTQVLPGGNYRRLGVGTAQNDDVVRVVLALQESNVWTEPIPREHAETEAPGSGSRSRARSWRRTEARSRRRVNRAAAASSPSTCPRPRRAAHEDEHDDRHGHPS